LKNLSNLEELYIWGGYKYLHRFKDYKFYNRANNLSLERNHRCEFDSASLSELIGQFQLHTLVINLKTIDTRVISNLSKQSQTI
jgi:hypothetical protein